MQSKLDPSDIVQETLLKAYQAISQFQGKTEAELLGWLRSILANTMMDAIRKFHRQMGAVEVSVERDLEQSSAHLERWLGSEDLSPAQHAQRQEELVHLAEALAKLPEDQQKAVELRYLQGYSVRQIGEHLSRSRTAVAGLLQRGLKKLRAELCKAPSVPESED